MLHDCTPCCLFCFCILCVTLHIVAHNSLDFREVRFTMTMVFAINEINSNSELLPGVILGYQIHDSCSFVPVAVKVAFQLANGVEPVFFPNQSCSKSGTVHAVVGESGSTPSIGISRILGPFGIPQVNFSCPVLDSMFCLTRWNNYYIIILELGEAKWCSGQHCSLTAQRSWFQIPAWAFLCGFCMFFLCLCGFPVGIPVSSRSDMQIWVIGESKLPQGMVCAFQWIGSLFMAIWSFCCFYKSWAVNYKVLTDIFEKCFCHKYVMYRALNTCVKFYEKNTVLQNEKTPNWLGTWIASN